MCCGCRACRERSVAPPRRWLTAGSPAMKEADMRLARLVKAGGAAIILAALVVGVPVLLVALVGWPLPRVVPSSDQVRVAVTEGDIAASTVMKAVAVVVWLAWLQVLWAVVWELAVNLPRHSRGAHIDRPP